MKWAITKEELVLAKACKQDEQLEKRGSRQLKNEVITKREGIQIHLDK